MTNQYLFDRIAGRNPNLRAADADRERTAEQLRKCHAEGRLDLEEFQERLERCYGAKTMGELGELVSDLPRPDLPDQRPSLALLPARGLMLAPVVPILVALFVISAATGGHVFWLWIPILFVFLRLSWWRGRRSWMGPRRGPTGWL